MGQEPIIWEKTRRNLAATLHIEDLVADPDRFDAMLDRWWVLGTPGSFDGIFPETDTSTLAQVSGPTSDSARLRKEIDRHDFRISDWSVERLFDELGAFDAADRRFAGFLEELVSHKVVVREDAQRRIVDAVNPHLCEVHLELCEVDAEGGYVVSCLVSDSRPPFYVDPASAAMGAHNANPGTAQLTAIANTRQACWLDHAFPASSVGGRVGVDDVDLVVDRIGHRGMAARGKLRHMTAGSRTRSPGSPPPPQPARPRRRCAPVSARLLTP